MNSQPAINLHIEELVLHGFAPGDRHRISEAIQQELTRLISEQPLRANKTISLEQVDAGSFQLQKQPPPARVGAQIAGAIHGGLAG